jgi:hypothetical protein
MEEAAAACFAAASFVNTLLLSNLTVANCKKM